MPRKYRCSRYLLFPRQDFDGLSLCQTGRDRVHCVRRWLSYEQAARHLETNALSQFEIQNRSQVLCQSGSRGNVYYMEFATADEAMSVSDRERLGSSSSSIAPDNRQKDEDKEEPLSQTSSNVIRLRVFGLSPISKRMKVALKQLLDDRLVELVARAISGVVTRSGTINAVNLNYVKLLGTLSDTSHSHNKEHKDSANNGETDEGEDEELFTGRPGL